MLEALERSNLFVVPLDDSRQWYRYHHLFADVLRAHLHEERPGEVADLHRRAADWYLGAGQPVPAVRHALAAGDVERAADVIERSAIALLRARQEATVRAWVDDIPDDVLSRRPVLAVAFIGALMSRNEFETVESRLDDLERILADPPAGLVVLEDAELARVPGAIQTYRAALALVAGDPAGTVAHAELAIASAAPGDDLTVAAAAALSGLASWGNGDLEAAHRGYSVAVERPGARREHRRRARLLDHPRRPADHPGTARRRRAHLRRRSPSRRRPRGRRTTARDGGHAGRPEPGRVREGLDLAGAAAYLRAGGHAR